MPLLSLSSVSTGITLLHKHSLKPSSILCSRQVRTAKYNFSLLGQQIGKDIIKTTVWSASKGGHQVSQSESMSTYLSVIAGVGAIMTS